jgi:hypothetical protein
MLTYEPLIEAVERGEELIPADLRFESLDETTTRLHPALRQFLREAREKFGQEYVYVGGAHDLRVVEVSGPFRIDEYDGSESVVEGTPDYISL